MSEQRPTKSPEKAKQRIECRESRPRSAPSCEGGPHPILQLQRTIGNRRVAELIQAKQFTPRGKIPGLQRKLTVGAARDQYEQEADRVADQVMRMPGTVLARSSIDPILQYDPHRDIGKRLPAHELTHVVQQNHGVQASPRGTLKHDAQHGVEHASGDRVSIPISKADTPMISRQEAPNRIWGGFRIGGDESYVRSIRDDLNQIHATANGRRLLQAIGENRSGIFTSLIRIQPSTACSFLPSGISFNAAGCHVSNACPAPSADWSAVPNYVYLYHEIVHAYLYHIAGQGTHPDRECMATGLGRYAADLPYNENRFRCELGLPVRPCYGNECHGFPAPTCDALAAADRQEEARRERERQAASARTYQDQVACVRRLGGCPESRSGGMPSDAEIVRYNDECRLETGYSGAAITPTCR